VKHAWKWGGLALSMLLTLALVPFAHALPALVASPHVLVAGATIGAGALTLWDVAKAFGPDGKVAKVAELLTQKNAMLDDIPWIEGNLPTGHRIVQRVGLPTVYFRLMNQGVPKSKSLRAQVDEQAAMIEARSEVDIKLAELNGDLNAFRLSEAMPFIEAMSQKLARTVIYGNSATDPEQFTGLAIRFSSSSATNGKNIILAPTGAGGDNSSIYLVGWSEETVHGIYPKGSKAGLVHENLGLQDAFDSSNNRFRAYMDRFAWDCGIAVKDWRYIVRIANIDISNLIADDAGATVKLLTYMAKAIDRIPNASGVNLVFYVNRTVASMLRVIALNKSVANLGVEPAINQFGKSIQQLVFLGIPVKLLDQLTETEAVIT
jgi:hypothetical protein